MLANFGYMLRHSGADICIKSGGKLAATTINVPADISSAAFFLVGAAIAEGSDVTLSHVGINPTRDGVITILRRMGADLEILNMREVGGEKVADIRVHVAICRGSHSRRAGTAGDR